MTTHRVENCLRLRAADPSLPEPNPADLPNGEGTEMTKKARKLYREQKKAQNIRAKYGPTRRPSPVVVKTLEGEVLYKVDQRAFTDRLAQNEVAQN